MTEIAVEIARKHFASGGVEALAECRFTAATGEFVSLVGPSGAGKSTILNIVGGLDHDYGGSVTAGGRIVTGSSHHPARIGYMFQEPRLMPWLTVAQNIELVLAGVRQRDDVVSLLEQVGLSGRAESFPGQLSGGMQRRVSLARAFAVRPDLLLMDEPFVSLDEPTAQRLRNLLLSLWRELKPTVLFVTHHLREAIALSDRIVFLSSSPGRVIHELEIDIPRPRDLNDTSIQKLYEKILREYPKILSGRVPAIAGGAPETGSPQRRSA
jgi:NitT/TauT family transport system ATP-binding protein